ncbi:UNVERIFIED_CONTAM: SUMO-activating enzyme subunit 1, partial [Siphonaria sp. JEL0065]
MSPNTRSKRTAPTPTREGAPSPSPHKSKKRRADDEEAEKQALVDHKEPTPIELSNSTTATTDGSMSAEEMELYDRQIRLWGLEAQTKMRTSRILVAGICGLSNEICKNIVLAGVGRVVLLDSHKVVERDLGAQFLLSLKDVGKNVAESVAPRIRNLNPRVNLETVDKDVAQVDDSFFNDFDLVLVSGKVAFDILVSTSVCNVFYVEFGRGILGNNDILDWDTPLAIRINNICRKQKIKFISAAVFGTHGYMFADLLEYEYV